MMQTESVVTGRGRARSESVVAGAPKTAADAKSMVEAAVQACHAEAKATPDKTISIYKQTGLLLVDMSMQDADLYQAIHFDTHEERCCDIAASYIQKQNKAIRQSAASARTPPSDPPQVRKDAIVREGVRISLMDMTIPGYRELGNTTGFQLRTAAAKGRKKAFTELHKCDFWDAVAAISGDHMTPLQAGITDQQLQDAFAATESEDTEV